MKQKIKDSVKMGLALFIGFAFLQFFIVGPDQANSATTCNCHCQDHAPSGVAYCFGSSVQCKDWCAGKVTIVEWGTLSLTAAWDWYQITGF